MTLPPALTVPVFLGIAAVGFLFLLILEKLPAILEASSGIFGAVAAPLGNIDKLVVIDQGNGSDNGSSSLGRLAKTSPTVVFNVLQQLEALGLNVPAMLQQLGLKSIAPESSQPSPPPSAPTAGPASTHRQT
jgi:hypothetical protein